MQSPAVPVPVSGAQVPNATLAGFSKLCGAGLPAPGPLVAYTLQSEGVDLAGGAHYGVVLAYQVNTGKEWLEFDAESRSLMASFGLRLEQVQKDYPCQHPHPVLASFTRTPQSHDPCRSLALHTPYSGPARPHGTAHFGRSSRRPSSAAGSARSPPR